MCHIRPRSRRRWLSLGPASPTTRAATTQPVRPAPARRLAPARSSSGGEVMQHFFPPMIDRDSTPTPAMPVLVRASDHRRSPIARARPPRPTSRKQMTIPFSSASDPDQENPNVQLLRCSAAAGTTRRPRLDPFEERQTDERRSAEARRRPSRPRRARRRRRKPGMTQPPVSPRRKPLADTTRIIFRG